MDIEDGVGEGADHLTGEDDHEAGQDHQVDVQRPQLLHQGGGHGLTGGKLLPGHHIAGDPRLCGPLQGVGARVGGDDSGDLTVDQLPTGLGVYEGLKIGAAAGDQYGDTFGHSEPPSELGIRNLGGLLDNVRRSRTLQFQTPHSSFYQTSSTPASPETTWPI